jgi:hypothetical protein
MKRSALVLFILLGFSAASFAGTDYVCSTVSIDAEDGSVFDRDDAKDVSIDWNSNQAGFSRKYPLQKAGRSVVTWTEVDGRGRTSVVKFDRQSLRIEEKVFKNGQLQWTESGRCRVEEDEE